MARVNVEKRAITDPRFRILGNRLSPITQASKADVEQAFGLYLAIRVWDYAQERGTDVLPGTFVEGIYEGLTDAMLEADLLEQVTSTTVRVKGWIDSDGGWLERQRRASRAGGSVRAAGAKRGPNGTFLPASSSDYPASLDQQYPAVSSAPTPVLSPAPSQIQTTSSNPPPADLDSPARVSPRKRNGTDPETLAYFDAFYADYPRHEGKQAALKAFVKLKPDKATLRQIVHDIGRRVEIGAWTPDDPERIKFIPLPATYLNGKRWEDGAI